MRRRGHRTAAAALVAAVAVLLAGCGSEVFYRGPLPEGERVEATPRTTAAAMLDHLEDTGVRAVGGVEEELDGADGRVLVATVAIGEAEISTSVTPEDPGTDGAALCGEVAEFCSPATATDDEGRETPYQVLWQPGSRGGDPGTVGMVLRRGDARISVSVSGPLIPASVDWTMFPVSRTVLESILLDEAIGQETLPHLVEQGETIEPFQDRAFNL